MSNQFIHENDLPRGSVYIFDIDDPRISSFSDSQISRPVMSQPRDRDHSHLDLKSIWASTENVIIRGLSLKKAKKELATLYSKQMAGFTPLEAQSCKLTPNHWEVFVVSVFVFQVR